MFADESARRDLERIVHPAVQAAIDTWLAATEREGHRLAIAVIPLLYETGRERDFDIVITTACAADEQLRRVMARDGFSELQARQRIAAQLSTEEKVGARTTRSGPTGRWMTRSARCSRRSNAWRDRASSVRSSVLGPWSLVLGEPKSRNSASYAVSAPRAACSSSAS